MVKPEIKQLITLYVDNCVGCSHWKDYELVGYFGKKTLMFQCPTCRTTKTVSLDELRG